MPDGYGITQVDIPGIYGAVQNARMGRIQQMLGERQIAAADRQANRDNAFSQTVAGLYGGAAPTGADGQPAGVHPAVAAYGQQPPGPGQPAVTPQGLPGADPGLPAATPPAPAAPMEINPQLAARLVTIDPERAGQYLTQLRGLRDDQATQMAAAETYLAHFGEHLSQNVPEAEWQQELQARTPDLIAHGVTPQQIQAFQLTRRNIEYRTAQALDMVHLIDESHPHLMVAPMNSDVIDPEHIDPTTGQARVVYQSGFVGSPESPMPRPPQMRANLPRPRTAAERDNLPPGAPYIAPDNTVHVRPGGASPSDGSGGFPRQDGGAFDFHNRPPGR